MNFDKATPELFAALSAAQGEVENAAKSSTNPHFKSKYADLAEVLNTVRPVLAKHGLVLIQSTSFDGSMVSVDCVIAHSTGGYISSRASCVPAKSDAQGVGSATTYLRRYSAAAMTCVGQEDDDGQSAAHDTPPAPVLSESQVADWLASIETAESEDLPIIAKNIASIAMSVAQKGTLRAAYAAKVKALKGK